MNVLVLGGSGGIGGAIIAEISRRYPGVRIFSTWMHKEPTILAGDTFDSDQSKVQWFRSDIRSESQVKDLLHKIKSALQKRSSADSEPSNSDLKLDWLINAVGVLHLNDRAPEKSIKQVDPDFFVNNMMSNTLPTLLLAKHFSSLIKQSDSPVFTTISAKVGSIEDNGLGGWTSYRCSKAALNMALKNISLEWQRTIPKACVVALHPGTTDTELSLPFQSNVPAGKLFSPQKTANYLVDIIEKLSSKDTGHFLSWDGANIPW